jgi:hypothetical protein
MRNEELGFYMWTCASNLHVYMIYSHSLSAYARALYHSILTILCSFSLLHDQDLSVILHPCMPVMSYVEVVL